jgi:UDP-N-acetylmuramate dehydrogenase
MAFPAGFEHIVRENESLAPYTWLQLGGNCRYFAEPTSHAQLQELVKVCHKESIAIKVLGGGSNLLIREEGFNGLVVSLGAPAFCQIEVVGNVVKAGGGAKLSHVVSASVGDGLAGIEYLVGIPGTLGGALHGNASTRDGDIGQRVLRAKLMTRTGEIVELEGSQLQFSYHQSSLDELVILQAELKLEKVSDPIALTKRMQKLWIVKRASQPTLGTMTVIPFIDPVGFSAADLIDEAGLSGARQGAAQLSSTFPNFLVLGSGATAGQVIALLEKVRSTVATKSGVQLQLHLKIW